MCGYYSSLRVSSHARARALCLTAASAFLSVPHSALHAMPALVDAHADDSLKHGVLNSGIYVGRVPQAGGSKVVFPQAEDLRPVSGGGDRGKFSAGRRCTGAGCRFTSRKATRHRYKAGQRRCGHTFPPPGGSWYPIRVTWIRIRHQAIDGLDEVVWNHKVGDLVAKG